ERSRSASCRRPTTASIATRERPVRPRPHMPSSGKFCRVRSLSLTMPDRCWRRSRGARIRQAFQEVSMNGAEVLDVGRDAIWLTIQLCAPVLIVGLLVGVGIGLLQALTQIQEATLVYAPKIVAIFVSLLVFLPMMGALM